MSRKRSILVFIMVSLVLTGLALAEGKVYQEQNGLIVIEAENFATSVAGPAHEWAPDTAIPGFSGSGYIITGTSGTNHNTFTGEAALTTYDIRIDHPGTYYAIARGCSPDGSGSRDSIWFAVNDVKPPARISCGAMKEGWAWCFGDGSKPVAYDLQVGDHVIKVWMRERGTAVDQIGLTLDASFKVEGHVPLPESPLGN